MARLRYSEGEDQIVVIVPRAVPSPVVKSDPSGCSDKTGIAGMVDSTDWRKIFGIPVNVHTEFLRTMVTARFTIFGQDVEDALSDSIDEKISEFILLLNRLASACLMIERDQTMLTTPFYDRNTFDSLYLTIEGGEGKMGVGRLGLNLAKLQLNSGAFVGVESEKIKSFLLNPNGVDEARRYLASGKALLDGGQPAEALLHLTIAAEMATTRFVHARLISAGVSRSKIDASDDQLTFSRMLNIDLFVLCPEDAKPDRQLIGKINELRVIRNKLMHEGKFT
jgi:hypothetical protein